MKPSTYLHNLKCIEKYRSRYPYELRTKVNYPRVVGIQRRLPTVHFVRIPLIKEAVWLFATQADVDLFKQLYTVLEDKNKQQPKEDDHVW